MSMPNSNSSDSSPASDQNTSALLLEFRSRASPLNKGTGSLARARVSSLEADLKAALSASASAWNDGTLNHLNDLTR